MMFGTNRGSEHIKDLIEAGTVGAEIGVWKGESSQRFVARKPKKLYLVDPWSIEPYRQESGEVWSRYVSRYSALVGSSDPEKFQAFYDDVAESVMNRYKIYSNVEVRRETSIDFFEYLEERGEKLDWIYIDGDHSYEGVYYDFEKALKVVKEGGIIIGDDYGVKEGVARAVNEWAEEHKKEFEIFGDDQVVVRL